MWCVLPMDLKYENCHCSFQSNTPMCVWLQGFWESNVLLNFLCLMIRSFKIHIRCDEVFREIISYYKPNNSPILLYSIYYPQSFDLIMRQAGTWKRPCRFVSLGWRKNIVLSQVSHSHFCQSKPSTIFLQIFIIVNKYSSNSPSDFYS